MLPKEVKDDVKRMGLLHAHYMQIVRYLQTEQRRWVDTKVAQAHIQRRFSSLPLGKRQSVNMLQEGPEVADGLTPEATKGQDPAVIEKLELVCAALTKQLNKGNRGRDERKDHRGDKARTRSSSRDRPDAQFKGCWHCGEEGHSRAKGRGQRPKA